MTTSTPAPPVLDVGHELSGLLENRDWFSSRQRPDDEYRVSVDTALLELENWLHDGRTYDKRNHRNAWKTMTADVSEVLEGRGPDMVLQTPSITALLQQLQQPDLGADQARRQQCRQLVTSSRTELAEQATLTAAFDDLVTAADDLATPAPTLQTRIDLLECCLRAAGRAVSAVLDSIGRVLDDLVGHQRRPGHSRRPDSRPHRGGHRPNREPIDLRPTGSVQAAAAASRTAR